jgi:hypothetical protein
MSRVCPQGHKLSINMILPPGAGRDYCTTCGWTDAEDARAATEMTELERTVTVENPGDEDPASPSR